MQANKMNIIFARISHILIPKELKSAEAACCLIKQFTNNSKKVRCLYTTKQLGLFYEPTHEYDKLKKSKRHIEWEERSFKDRLKDELALWKEEVKLWWSETNEKLHLDPIFIYYHNEIDIQWRFTGDPDELDSWVVTCDSDHGDGFSTATLSFSEQGTGVFEGYLDTKIPKTGQIKHTGYCNIRTAPKFQSFKREIPYDWGQYNHLVMKVRGDGRIYSVNLHMFNAVDILKYDTFHYFLYTRGGPYWQYVKIPFSKFFLSNKGRVQNTQFPLDAMSIRYLSFTASDKFSGPFRLEIDHIGVLKDNSHTEESAYELYKWDKIMV